MSSETEAVMRRVHQLVDTYRSRCLWYLREDYYPKDPAEACKVLEAIERNGDVAAFRNAAELRQWLLHNTNASSVA
jgi:hypothetical protein